jgi:hypothetical protein
MVFGLLIVYNSFSCFYPLILSLLENKLHGLFVFAFFRVITISNKFLFLGWR